MSGATFSGGIRLEDAHQDFAVVRADVDMGSGQSAENRPEDCDGAPGADAAGHRKAKNHDKNERRNQNDRNPEQKER